MSNLKRHVIPLIGHCESANVGQVPVFKGRADECRNNRDNTVSDFKKSSTLLPEGGKHPVNGPRFHHVRVRITRHVLPCHDSMASVMSATATRPTACCTS